tara:strand:- start:26 stop:733 length:708 start_codon:yes stop_codon:yes gene_type:complete
MIIKNEGIIIYKKKIKDNDLYIRILSKDDQIVSGIVYGGNSSKKQSIFQLGYFIDYSSIKKNVNAITSLNAELTKPFIGTLINDNYKSHCLLAIISLINLSIVEGQKISNFYISIKNLIETISFQKHWLSFFFEWLFLLLELIGYQIDYKNNKGYKYYNLSNKEFQNLKNKNSILFPHKIFQHSGSPNIEEINSLFTIFENIYINNHLNNLSYMMPITFINFKKLIIKTIHNSSK